jgi:hypothetical protein
LFFVSAVGVARHYFRKRARLDNFKQNLMTDGSRFARILLILLLTGLRWVSAWAEDHPPTAAQSEPCRVAAVDYQGWHGQQLSNRWVQLIIAPQNGGRLIQVSFNGHPYLFVNPQLAGKYFPPTRGKWFNYGGDKLWLLPEGNNDEQHWVGDSDVIDDAPFTFQSFSAGKQCEIELTGPSDPQTGIQFSRRIRLDSDSPRISFRASMKNITGHTLQWSMQSVSQYNTADASSPTGFNQNFRTYTPANPSSSYLNRYHVRFGPAENPAVGVREDGFFSVHYVHMAAELWLDSTAGWLAVVDENSHYAMVERFEYQETKSYPGKASVIFWTNGPEMRLQGDGTPSLSDNPDAGPYYLEAELNSPLCKLRAGESCSFETEWFPARAGKEFHGVTDAGLLISGLRAREQDGKVKLSGDFGVFFSGHLVARFYDEHGALLGTMAVVKVEPSQPVSLNAEIVPPGKAVRVSLHLEDENGVDRGALNEVEISAGDNR